MRPSRSVPLLPDPKSLPSLARRKPLVDVNRVSPSADPSVSRDVSVDSSILYPARILSLVPEALSMVSTGSSVLPEGFRNSFPFHLIHVHNSYICDGYVPYDNQRDT